MYSIVLKDGKIINIDATEVEIRAVVDKINNIPQPCYHHGPIRGVCKSTRCSECEVLKGGKKNA